MVTRGYEPRPGVPAVRWEPTSLAMSISRGSVRLIVAYGGTRSASARNKTCGLACHDERQDQLQKGDDVAGAIRNLADDPFSGRHPTSHERLTGLPWDLSYHDGPPPWDIGQPQPAIVRLASEGGF